MSSPPSPAPQPEAWAEVRARDHVMRYRRSGAGHAVLVLCPPDAPAPVWPELAGVLAGRFRLIVPELPEDRADVAVWLADFLEGLGIARVAVIAADPLCVPGLELALLDQDRVSRIVLVPAGESTDTGLLGTLAGPLRQGRTVPLLVVRGGLPAAEAVPMVAGFLEEVRGGREEG